MNNVNNRVGMLNEVHIGLSVRVGGVSGKLRWLKQKDGKVTLSVGERVVTVDASAPYELLFTHQPA